MDVDVDRVHRCDREREYREMHTQRYYGDDGDEAHEIRVQKLKDAEQLARNQQAHLQGKYQHAGPMAGSAAIAGPAVQPAAQTTAAKGAKTGSGK
jgi:hypothetical protein